jgi:hypothetical protein
LLPSPLPSLPPPSRDAPIEPTIGYRLIASSFTAQVGPDGAIRFGEGRAGFWAGADPVAGLVALLQFDGDGFATDDPYLPQKLQLMEATQEERWAMRVAHDEVVMRRALDDLPRYLDAVWSRPGWSASTRRELLFALWDEAAEDGNELLRAGGDEARRIIEAFVAEQIPRGTAHAFADAEIAELNRRRESREAFEPYRARSPVRPAADPDEDEPAAPSSVEADSTVLYAALRAF